VQDTGSLPDRSLADPPPASLAGELIRRGWRGDIAGLRDWPGWIDLSWILLWLLGLAGILIFEQWEAIPFHLIWISFALLYSFRVRATGPTLWVLAAMIATTFAAISFDVVRGEQPADELAEVPLMAVMFLVMMWHGQRRLAANAERIRVSEENARLLATQRRFLQDASHQLRTPITIALGHSELLARNLIQSQDRRDIDVVVGELNRLRTLSDRLLQIAASAVPEFLQPEPVDLDSFITDALWRWRPAADRHWQLGQLDEATTVADAERLSLAIDALLENATQHTGPDDLIRLSVVRDDPAGMVSLVVQDTGAGIAPADLEHIFERFTTGAAPAGRRGTGLGLALVRAVAQGHGGEVRARSTPGLGSRFEVVLPVAVSPRPDRLSVSQLTTPAEAAAPLPPEPDASPDDSYRSTR
jgi:signal transduction histidine kinase